MSNHIHLVLSSLFFSISSTLSIIESRYAKYFNKRLNRIGHVFYDRFKSLICQRDSYFKALIRYIHFNPVRAGMSTDPAAWPYSSHLEYLGYKSRGLVDQELLLEMFHPDRKLARETYTEFMSADAHAAPPVVDPATLAPMIYPDRTLPLITDPESIQASLHEVAQVCSNGDTALLRIPSKRRNLCSMRHEFMRQAFQYGYPPTQIAAYLGLSLSAVSRTLNRI
jgi:hypothetical protein